MEFSEDIVKLLKDRYPDKDIYNMSLEELKDLLLNLQNVRGIKHILISKNWWKETNNKQETVKDIFNSR